jgi:hypothetical protein
MMSIRPGERFPSRPFPNLLAAIATCKFRMVASKLNIHGKGFPNQHAERV